MGYKIEDQIPELPHHGKQKPLQLYERTTNRIRKMSNDQMTNEESYKQFDDNVEVVKGGTSTYWD